MFLSAALRMVLDHMSVFAAPDMRGRWALSGRVVMAAVVLGNAVGLVANAAAAVYYQKAAEATSTASAALAANNTKDGVYFHSLGQRGLPPNHKETRYRQQSRQPPWAAALALLLPPQRHPPRYPQSPASN